MVYPDGWKDRGVSGLVCLAGFYHLSSNQEKLVQTLEKLAPLLEWARTEDRRLAVKRWKSDARIYLSIVEKWEDSVLKLHEISFAYYLIGVTLCSDETNYSRKTDLIDFLKDGEYQLEPRNLKISTRLLAEVLMLNM